MLSSQPSIADDVFELTRDELDELPFGVITLDRAGIILRYNRAEEDLSGRVTRTTVGLGFFTDVAPCTNVQAFRGRFDQFALGWDSGVERFDFSFNFRWGRQDVSITMLRKAAHDEINILVHGDAINAVRERAVVERRQRTHKPVERRSPIGVYGVSSLAPPTICRLGGADEANLRRGIHVDDAANVERLVAAASRDRTPYAIEYRRILLDSSVAIVEEYGHFDAAADAPGYATIVDVSARRQSEENHWRAAHYDSLTGLPNQQLFLQRVAEAVQEAEENGRMAAVLFSDIDKFRETNDMFGREVGNQLLKLIALRLGECVRGGDAVGRFVGDMFAVLLTDVDTRASVAETAKRLIAAFAEPFIIDERPFHLTLTIGICLAPDDCSDPALILSSAYTAMCAAKTAAPNGLRWYDAAMSTDAADSARRRNELREALENHRLELHYQPIVDLARDRIVAVEALARWNHPSRGFVPPVEFIALADKTGLIVALGEWVLREACRQAREWCDLGYELRVCVNVSAIQFRQPKFVALVTAVLAENGIAPDRLELELTESVMVDGFGSMMEKLSRLKSLGVRLAIDDFGTGYSSLAYLKYFPVDTLKIDRAFITDIATDKFDRAIATAVLTLANELGLDCVVEGVEKAEQRDILRGLGCSIMQGYHFCKPAPPAQLRAILGSSVAALQR